MIAGSCMTPLPWFAARLMHTTQGNSELGYSSSLEVRTARRATRYSYDSFQLHAVLAFR